MKKLTEEQEEAVIDYHKTRENEALEEFWDEFNKETLYEEWK